jgi:hypothetical protein
MFMLLIAALDSRGYRTAAQEQVKETVPSYTGQEALYRARGVFLVGAQRRLPGDIRRQSPFNALSGTRIAVRGGAAVISKLDVGYTTALHVLHHAQGHAHNSRFGGPYNFGTCHSGKPDPRGQLPTMVSHQASDRALLRA